MGAEAVYVDGDPAAASAPDPPLGFLRAWFLSVATPPPTTPASRDHSFDSHADGGGGGSGGSGDLGAAPERSPTASVLLKRNWWPFIFHASNLLLHAINTSLVYWLAFVIFNMRISRQEPEPEPEAGTACGEGCTGEGGCTGGNSDGSSSATAPNRNPDDLFRRRAILLASLTALFFAVHPVHTEAVSGIVGHADLLCCAFFLFALLLWWGGNLCTGVSSSSADGNSGDPSMLQPFRAALTNAALVCFLASTFSKEVGFTLVAVFVVIDSLHAMIIITLCGVPFPALPAGSASAAVATAATHTNANERGQQQHHSSKRGGGGGSSNGNVSSSSASAPSSTPPPVALHTWFLHFASLVWPRFLLLLLLSTFYLLLRRMLCGTALGVGEAVFRPTENPLAFEPRFWARLGSRAMVHAKYAQLLFAPWDLCCDYSHACLPVVERLDDLRWVPGVAVWAGVLAACGWTAIQLARLLDAKRRESMRILWAMHIGQPVPSLSSSAASATAATAAAANGGTGAPAPSSSFSGHKSKWRAQGLVRAVQGALSLTGPYCAPFGAANPALSLSLLVSLALALTLLLAPLTPALHLFAYPGTLVAERLVYVPSVGACMLIALALERACFAGLQWRELDQATMQKQRARTNRQTKQTTGPAAAAAASVPAASVPASPARPLRGPHRRRVLVLTLLALLTLATWSALLVRRNADWSSERALFFSAYAVCPSSIKVLQNLAVLHRREGDYPSALALLQRIPGLDPAGTYCEHTYWIGVTRVNMGAVDAGIAALKRALACPYTRNQALAALHKLFEQMLKNGAATERQQSGDAGAAGLASRSGSGSSSGTGSSGINVSPTPTPAQLRQELHVLREWASIMGEVGQAESAAKYFLHAGGLAYSAGEVAAARADFELAWRASRRLVYDWRGRLLNDPNAPPRGSDADALAAGLAENDLAAMEDGAGGIGGSGADSAGSSEPSSSSSSPSSAESNIYSSRNMRCASDYWLGRAQLQLGQSVSGVSLLRQVVLASAPAVRVNNCREFKLHALDHLAEQAQRDLQTVAEEANNAASDAAAVASTSSSGGGGTKAKSTKRDRTGKRAAAADSDASGGSSGGSIVADSSVSRQAEAHALLAFVLSHLGKNLTAAQHYHASAHLLEGKIEGAAAAAATAAVPPSAAPLPVPTAAERARAIELYRLAIAHDPHLERARYALAIALIETNRGVEEGVLLLRMTVTSSDPQVRSSSIAALHTLQMVYGIVDHPQ